MTTLATPTRAAVDDSSWDGPAAMSACAKSDDPAACYAAICAGRKSGDADKQSSYALPHHKHPGDAPNAAGVRNALSRLPQTDGLTNKAAAQKHLDAHMNAISPDDSDANLPEGETRATMHDHSGPDGTVSHAHSSHDAEPGHSHHADSAHGSLGPMLTEETEPDGDTDNPLEVVGATASEPGVSDVNSAAPKDNLIRARLGAGVSLRAADEGNAGVLFGIFSEFNTWYEVDSLWEGHFLERVLPGAFVDTIKNDRSSMRVLFDHGMDLQLNYKPLGPIAVLEERDEGPYYEVPLYDTDYNREQIVPLLRGTLMSGEEVGSGLGASFRFQVQEEKWNRQPKASKRNPDGLPERSIMRAKVFEFGPVTFPANAGATAGARSLSDHWLARLAGDPRFFAEFSERVGAKVAGRILDSVPEDLRQAAHSPEPVVVNPHQDVLRRRARALLVTAH